MMSVEKQMKLFIPGPTDVAPEIFTAMSRPMIGHRSKEYAKLHAGIKWKLKKLLETEGRVFISTSSAFGVMEGLLHSLVSDNEHVLNLRNGAFSDKWHDVTLRTGKLATALSFDWGQPVCPEKLDEELATSRYDAVTLIHNETSTGVMSDLWGIAEVMKKYPDVLFIVDIVSSAGAVRIPVDELGIDCCIFGVQKAFALPPGLAIFTASEKALARAKEVESRGYYFDLLEFAEADDKDNTPSTPAIATMYGLDAQLDRMFAEGLMNRFDRHLLMARTVRHWAKTNGLNLFSADGAHSRTLTCVENTFGHDLPAIQLAMAERGYTIDIGYGKVKGKTFRVAHMGERTLPETKTFLALLSEVMGLENPATA